VKFAQLIGRNIGKPVSMAEALTGRTTRWIVEKFGVSDSTARRWRRGAQQTRDPGKRDAVMGSSDRDTRRKIAANAMRGATGMSVGKIGVDADTGRATGSRRLGTIQLGREGTEKMELAADALERGDMAEAERLMSDAILHSDGRDYGPLHVSDYGPGFNLI
jgi:hypothetical protein